MSKLMLLSFLLLSGLANARDLHLCYETSEYQPYTKGVDNVPKKNRGDMVELLDKAVKNAGMTPVFYRRPWSRCIKDLISGKADAIFPTLWTKERESWGQFPTTKSGKLDNTRSLRQATYRIFVPSSRKTEFDGSKFSNLSSGIGAPHGYVVYHQLKSEGVLSPMNLEADQGFKMLALNRIDGYVVEQKVGRKIIEHKGWQNKIKMLDTAYYVTHFHMQFSHSFYKSHAEDADNIWLEASKLRGDFLNR